MKVRTLIRLDCMADNLRLNQYYKDHGFNFIRRINGEGWSVKGVGHRENNNVR